MFGIAPKRTALNSQTSYNCKEKEMSSKNINDKEVDDEKVEKPEAEQPTKKSRIPKRKVTKQAERIKELENKLAEAEDQNLRLRAEYDNYRKRSYRELSDARAYAKTDTLTPFLNVFDHFKMAVTAADTTDDMQVIQEGLKMINSEFAKAMEELGVTEGDAVGDSFDPNIHEAVAEEVSDEDEGIIIKQWRCGYKIGDRLLRPASVVVSSGPDNAEPEDAK